MLLLIDNYDSFVFNLARYLAQLGQDVRVVRNDQLTVDQALAVNPRAIVISPGPGGPEQAGICIPLIQAAVGRVPLLGVCLGHQALGAALGGSVVRGTPCHGQSSWVCHDGLGEFAGLPPSLAVGRYHSLIVSESGLPAELTVSARTDDGTIMALRHRQFPICGWQFHPESILTSFGLEMLAGFLRLAGLPYELPDGATDPASVTRIQTNPDLNSNARQAGEERTLAVGSAKTELPPVQGVQADGQTEFPAGWAWPVGGWGANATQPHVYLPHKPKNLLEGA